MTLSILGNQCNEEVQVKLFSMLSKESLLNLETLTNLGGGVCHDLHKPLHPRLALPVDKQRQDVRHVGAVYGVEEGLPLHRVQFRRFFRVSILVDKLQTRNKGISNFLQGDLARCRSGNGEKLSNSQAEPGQAIKSDIA